MLPRIKEDDRSLQHWVTCGLGHGARFSQTFHLRLLESWSRLGKSIPQKLLRRGCLPPRYGFLPIIIGKIGKCGDYLLRFDGGN